jgi:hypothetical protein
MEVLNELGDRVRLAYGEFTGMDGVRVKENVPEVGADVIQSAGLLVVRVENSRL